MRVVKGSRARKMEHGARPGVLRRWELAPNRAWSRTPSMGRGSVDSLRPPPTRDRCPDQQTNISRGVLQGRIDSIAVLTVAHTEPSPPYVIARIERLNSAFG
jgi:hypothetical protein